MDIRDHKPLYYTLGGADGRTPIPTHDVLVWGRFFESRRADGLELRRVAYTGLLSGGCVSTVFLGLDYSFARMMDPGAPPLLFETMAFLPDGETDQDRYATWAQAEAGHAAMVARHAGRRTAASDK